MAGKTVANAVSTFGASVKSKLASIAISGAPEDQLRAPLDALVRDLAEIGGFPSGAVHLVGETSLAHIKTRPDYAVVVAIAAAIGAAPSSATAVRLRRSTAFSRKAGWPNTQPTCSTCCTSSAASSRWNPRKPTCWIASAPTRCAVPTSFAPPGRSQSRKLRRRRSRAKARPEWRPCELRGQVQRVARAARQDRA